MRTIWMINRLVPRDSRAKYLATLAAGAVIFAGVCAKAEADHMTVYSCHAPNGEAVASEGWTISRTGQSRMAATNTCAANNAGTMGLEVAANPSGYPNGAGIGWVFSAPSWATIAKYTIHVPDSFTYFSDAGIVGQALVQADDETDPVYDYRNLGGGSYGPITVERTPLDAVKSINVSASCDGEGGPCPANTLISRMDVASSALTLNDSTIPGVSGLSGSLTSGSPLRGTVEANFTATDKGPGIYSAWFVIDGKAEPAVLLDPNNGWCVNLGQTNDGTRSFAYPDPCAESVNSSMTFNTTALQDGSHNIKLDVDDASGNSTTAYNATVTTDNAPAILTAPGISGNSTVGSTLTGSNGTFSAPQGAGTVSSVQSAWLRCSDAAGTNCSTITGENSSAYDPTAVDIGYHLVYRNTVSDNDGTTVSDSPPTPEINNPGNGAGNSGTAGGNGAGGAGGSGASGGAGGSGAGNSLTVVLPGSNQGSVLLGSNVKWRVSLSVSPRRVRRHSKIKLSGVVLTSPRPGSGKLIYLQARSVGSVWRGRGRRRVTVYGKWVTFEAFRAKSSGSFASSYTFKLGGHHTYQFQAVAPAEGQFRNPTGTSSTITVKEV